MLAGALLGLAAQAAAQPRPRDDMARARALDQQGAKAYQDGRYNDAIRYFEEAYRLGGPPFELWNIAKCHLRLDQPEQAAEVLERYLATPNLPPEDRKEASQQLEELKQRPSSLTVASSPSGANVTVDGKPPGEGSHTPVTVTVQPGPHTVMVTMPNYAVCTRQVEARYGRAIILDATLAKDTKDDRPPPPANPYVPEPAKPFAVRALIGAVLPRYGNVGGETAPGFIASGTYVVARPGATALGLGALFFLTGDTWKNTVQAPTVVNGCGQLQNPNRGTAFSAYALGSAAYEIVPKLSVVGLGGLGVASYFIGDVGGDVFIPSCTTTPGLRPSLLLGGQLDWAVSSAVRLTVQPITLQLHPAFAAVRTTPKDASGLWMRATIAFGAGVDF